MALESFVLAGDDTKPLKPWLQIGFTITAWLLLSVFSAASCCSLMLAIFLKKKLLFLDGALASAASNPDFREIYDRWYEPVCWIAFILFFISATAALGMLHRKAWSVAWLRRLAWVWGGLPILALVWWGLSLCGLVNTLPPMDTPGVAFCAACIPLSLAFHQALACPQVLAEFGKTKAKKITFVPGLMMLPS